ncbi:hypothetical protein HYPSUDRAFT_209058 [Hypholoma sublateritium FD-334 SS-4]|uniref:Uncharacterized protein n=1 Tax=Hypholoma sublateritium (strain FD-334 SS-4) TaxID=945553 RepID=A0A0D2N4A6_HYPSF|nr:hypothetical protein HYPSUDRAFT_209058 [Hypholoma sublateritium FD-334 SS-4]
MDTSTLALLREIAVSLAQGHAVIANILKANGDTAPISGPAFHEFVAPHQRWYAMFAGTHPGVYQGIENVPNRLESKAITIRFNSEDDAQYHFHQAVESGKVTIITNGEERVFTIDDMTHM